MKYITPQLKTKLFGNLGVSYVLSGEEGHNRVKNEDGTWRDSDQKLITGDITPQNDLIFLDFMNCAGETGSITVNSEELRAFAKELISWADIMEEVN